MSKRWNSILTILALSLSAISAPALPNFDAPKLVREGGEAGGGGGTANPGQPLKAAEIKAILEKIQRPTAAFFNYVSIAKYHSERGIFGSEGKEAADLGVKLYGGQPADGIVRKVLTVKPTILETGACPDPDGIHKEASALTHPDRVCFSLELLEKRGDIYSTNAWTILVALAAHEYTHLLVAGESGPEFIQNEIALNTLTERVSKIVWEYGDRSDDLLWLSREVGNLQAMVKRRAPADDLCYFLGTVTANVGLRTASWFDGNAGVSYFSRAEYDRALPALYKMNQLGNFCRDTAEARSWKSKVFGGKKEISVEEYLVAMGSSGHIHVEGTVRRIDHGDYGTLEREMADLVDALAALRTANLWQLKTR